MTDNKELLLTELGIEHMVIDPHCIAVAAGIMSKGEHSPQCPACAVLKAKEYYEPIIKERREQVKMWKKKHWELQGRVNNEIAKLKIHYEPLIEQAKQKILSHYAFSTPKFNGYGELYEYEVTLKYKPEEYEALKQELEGDK